MISGFFNTLPTIASSLFTFDVLIALLIGVVGGMVIGALPGLSATMGIALMIPFTYATCNAHDDLYLGNRWRFYLCHSDPHPRYAVVGCNSNGRIPSHTSGTWSGGSRHGYGQFHDWRNDQRDRTAVSLPAAGFCRTEIWLCREFLSCGFWPEHHCEPRLRKSE